jgi:hypothetical protein
MQTVHHKSIIFSKLYDKIVIKVYLLKLGGLFSGEEHAARGRERVVR